MERAAKQLKYIYTKKTPLNQRRKTLFFGEIIQNTFNKIITHAPIVIHNISYGFCLIMLQSITSTNYALSIYLLLTLKHDIMKGILIVALLLITYNVNAQSGIQIINNTNCEVWFTLRGNTTAVCGTNPYSSNALSIPCCSTSVLYANPSNVPGGMQNSSAVFLTSSDYINLISIHNSDPAGTCYVSSVRLSDCNTSESHYTSDNNCQDECGLSITWTPAGGGTTYSIVTIN